MLQVLFAGLVEVKQSCGADARSLCWGKVMHIFWGKFRTTESWKSAKSLQTLPAE